MHYTSSRQRGASLIEALIALLVAGFGMLSLVALQVTLARSADVARQRGEATRLAQQQVEQLRAFSTLAVFDARAASAADVPTGKMLSTSFLRSTTLTPSTDNSHRVVRVAVAWSDRASEPQQVDLRTVIARVNPSQSGDVEFPPPGGQALRRPKNRNMNIPVPATELGGGRSSLPFTANGITGSIVFGDDSGNVVKQCSFVVKTAADLDDSRCITVDALLLAGYVTKTMASFPATLGVNTALISTSGTGAVQCSFGDASDQNFDPITGTSGVTGVDAVLNTKYYLCVVPIAKGGTWSGQVRLSGMNTGTDYLVCRFEYAASQGGTPNDRNHQPYDKVDSSLDNQNYIITTNSTCPQVTSPAVPPATPTTLQTVLHQDCRAVNANRATDCPAT
jgi:Tfp pilus assembly protein PilV